MGQRHAICCAIACGEGLAFQPFAIIEIAEQRAFRPCRPAVNTLMVSPEEHQVNRPCVIGMFRDTPADAGRQRIESRPVITVITTSHLVAEGPFVADGVFRHLPASPAAPRSGKEQPEMLFGPNDARPYAVDEEFEPLRH